MGDLPLVEGDVFELKPEKQYMMGFDKRAIDRATINDLQQALERRKVNNIRVMIDGAVNTSIQIIEGELDEQQN